MRYILLSADRTPVLYEAPDRVASQLADYAYQFLDEINQPDSPFWRRVTDAAAGEAYLCLSYDVPDFLAWLNRQPETRDQPVREAEGISKEEREIIMDTARKERYIPYDRQQYPWFSF